MTSSDPVTTSLPDTTFPHDRGLLSGLSWGVYLGVSWTWVIGMFFPILLVRDHGLWGWLLFAVPNVLGAAAMGFVLTPQSSRLMVLRHGGMIRLFSQITIAFQVYVLGWFLLRDTLHPVLMTGCLGLLLMLALATAVPLAAERWMPWIRGVCLIIWCFSMVSFVAGWLQPEAWRPHAPGNPQQTPPLSSLHLWAFLPVSLFGFLFCPYLDRTFHLARERTSQRTGQLAFASGFGFFFLMMILWTLCYAGVGASWVAGNALPATWALWLIPHLSVQGLITIFLHARETGRGRAPSESAAAVASPPLSRILHLSWPVALALPLLWLAIDHDPATGKEDLYQIGRYSLGEGIYRSFLLCYGTLFPTYLWLCVIPTWRAQAPALRRRVGLFALTSLLVIPMGAMIFLWDQPVWILPTIAVLMLARLALEIAASDRQKSPAV